MSIPSRHVYNEVTEYKLREKIFSISGDTFTVKHVATGVDAFKIIGKPLSIREKKTMSEMNGTKLFRMKEKVISLRKSMCIEDANTGTTLYNLRRKNYIQLFKPAVQVWQGSSSKADPIFEIQGNVLRKNFTINDKRSNCVAAKVTKKYLSPTNILTASDVYTVKVNPGHDTALMIFLAVAVDEAFHD